MAGGYVNAANDTAGQTLGGTTEAGSAVKLIFNTWGMRTERNPLI
jgi:hypothetical protein